MMEGELGWGVLQSRKEVGGVQDTGTVMFPKGQKVSSVAGYQVLGICRQYTFQDSVVGVSALDHIRVALGVNDVGSVA